MKKTINAFKESIEWLEQASILLEKGTLEDLLNYYQVGYTSGTWHFPSIVAKYNNEVPKQLTVFLNEILKPTGFFIDEEQAEKSKQFMLYYGEPHLLKGVPVRSGKYICSINMYKRSLNSSNDVDAEIEKTKEKLTLEIDRLLDLKIVEFGEDETEIQVEKSGLLFKNLFNRKNREAFVPKEKNTDEKRQAEIEKSECRIQELKERIHLLEQLQMDIQKLMDALTPYGFTFEGFFIRNFKRFSLYELMDSEENVNEFLKVHTSKGIRFVGRYIAFDTMLFRRKAIVEIEKEYLRFTSGEIKQSHFVSLLLKGKKLGLAVNNIHFNLHHEEEPKWLRDKLQESLHKKDSTGLAYVIKNYHLEGYEVTDMEFEWDANRIAVTQNGEIAITSPVFVPQDILNSECISILLGNNNNKNESV